MNMPPAIKWLSVGPEAAAILARLHNEIFADSLHDVWSETDFSQILSLPTTKALLALILEGAATKKDKPDRPAGFVIFSQVLDECEILTLGVEPELRRTGIGHDLLRTVLERARQAAVKSIFLEVREDNQAALHLYQRHGFTLAGRRRGYYRLNSGQQLDAVLMRKNIE